MSTILPLLDSPVIQRLGWTLLHFVWQGALIGALAAVGLLLLRRATSSARYALLLTAFVMLALAPVATFTVVTPVPASTNAAEHPLPNAPVLNRPSGAPIGVADSAFPPAARDEPPAGVTPTPALSSSMNSAPSKPAESKLAPTLADRCRPALPWLVAAWVAGVILLTLRLVGAWRRLRRLLTRDVRPLVDRWATLTSHMCDAFEVHRRVQFVESRLADVPVVISWFRPVVVVPASIMTNLTPAEVEALLAHELAHIRRWDDVVNLLQTVIETLLFYHPAVWWLSARLRQEREHCCDDVAAEMIGDRLVYSRALVAAAQLAATRPERLAVAATGGQLAVRIRRLLGIPVTGPSQPQSRWPVVVILLLALLTTVGLLASTPFADESPAAPSAGDTQDADDNPAIAAGIVLGPDGKPVGDATVILLGESEKLTVFQVGRENRIRIEPEQGGRRLPTNPLGEFDVPAEVDWNRLAVVCDACPLWVVERKQLADAPAARVTLPATGHINALIDLPSKQEQVELSLSLRSFDGRTWGRDVLVRHSIDVPNPAETLIGGVPPGTYAIERIEVVHFGTHGLLHDCERQIVHVSSEDAAEAVFSRQFGTPVTGTVTGLDRDDFGHASLAVQYWGPAEQPRPDGRRSRQLTHFDAVKLERDGTFRIDPLPPGEYAFTVSAYLNGRRGGSPDLHGSVLVSVPVAGEVPPVTIEVSADAKYVLPPSPDDPDRITVDPNAPTPAGPDRESTDAAPVDVTPAQLVAGIEQAMQRISAVDYSARYSEQRDANAFRDGAEPLPVSGTGEYTFRTDGRRWYADEHGFTYQIGTTDVRPTRAISGFDGTVHYIREGDIVTLGEDHLAVERRAPAHVFWEVGRNWSWLKAALNDPSARITAQPENDGHPCVAVHSEWSPAWAGTTYVYDIVISPEQSYLPLKCTMTEKGQVEDSWQIPELAQTPEGVWFPRTIQISHRQGFPNLSQQLTINSFALRNDFSDDDFAYPTPAAVDVVDYPRGTVYFNDPWHSELSRWMRDRFEFPSPWIQPTDDIGSYSNGAIDGKPAPPIEASEWIGGDPGPWKRAGRQYTILFFFGGRLISPTPQWIASLKALQQKYGEAGVELIGVASSSSVEEVRQTVRELNITFPVAIATPSDQAGSFGRTHDAFGLPTYTGVFVIDPEGNVHIVKNPQPEGDAQLALESLIQKLLGLPPDEFARPETGLPIESWRATIKEWRRRRSTAAAAARIAGTVQYNHPVTRLPDYSGVEVTVTPHLRVVSGHTPSGHIVHSEMDEAARTSCDRDGNFEFTKLRKGTYTLTVNVQNYEKVEQLIAVGADESESAVDVKVLLNRSGDK